MRKFVIFLSLNICMIFCGKTCFGTTFSQANEAYNQKRYEDAISLYLQCVNEGNKNAYLFYNLGNAYLKNDQLGKAILYYEKAYRLDPTNEDIRHNLAFANSKTIDKVNIDADFVLKRWAISFLYLFSVQGWAFLSILFSILLCVSLVVFLLAKKSNLRVGFFFTSLIFGLFIIISIVMASVENYRLKSKNEVIVTQLNVTVKSMPDESGTDLFTVHEGIKAIISDKADKWIEVKFPNGEKGWILAESSEII